MLIATVPYVGKRLHLDPDPEPDPDPDPKLNYGSGSEHANNFGSGRIRIHKPVFCHCLLQVKMLCRFRVQVRVVMCTFAIWEIYIEPKYASIGCGCHCQDCPINHHEGGGKNNHRHCLYCINWVR
jgi:hypothetical protein